MVVKTIIRVLEYSVKIMKEKCVDTGFYLSLREFLSLWKRMKNN